MRQGLQRRVAKGTACWASVLALAIVPVDAEAAESAPASASLTLEPSVGASLSIGLSDGLLLQIGLPRARRTVRPGPDMPGMVLTFEGAEVVADSAVSLRVERRAARSTPLGAYGAEGEGGALLILAQFN